MKHADGCSEHNKYQIKRVILFYPLLTLIFDMSTFCSSTSLWHSVNYFLTSRLTLSLAFCNSSQRLSFECNRSVQFILQRTPDLLDGVEVRASRGKSIIFMFPQIPSVAGSSGYSSFYGYFNGKFNKKLKPLKYAKCSNNFGHHCM